MSGLSRVNPRLFYLNNSGVETEATATVPYPVISTAHLRIHEGRSFAAGYHDIALADDGIINILVQVGSKALHTVLDVSCGGDATVTIFEGTTFSGEGTARTAFNKARWSSTASTATITHTPTITGDGTEFPTKLVAGGTGGNSGGGQDGGFDREFDMKANTNYLIRAKNIAGGAKPLSVILEWYE